MSSADAVPDDEGGRAGKSDEIGMLFGIRGMIGGLVEELTVAANIFLGVGEAQGAGRIAPRRLFRSQASESQGETIRRQA